VPINLTPRHGRAMDPSLGIIPRPGRPKLGVSNFLRGHLETVLEPSRSLWIHMSESLADIEDPGIREGR
jgi:hypothetical protein